MKRYKITLGIQTTDTQGQFFSAIQTVYASGENVVVALKNALRRESIERETIHTVTVSQA